jgi:hypothetical protein
MIDRVGLRENAGDFMPRRFHPGRFIPQGDAGLFAVRAHTGRPDAPPHDFGLTSLFQRECLARTGPATDVQKLILDVQTYRWMAANSVQPFFGLSGRQLLTREAS